MTWEKINNYAFTYRELIENIKHVMHYISSKQQRNIWNLAEHIILRQSLSSNQRITTLREGKPILLYNQAKHHYKNPHLSIHLHLSVCISICPSTYLFACIPTYIIPSTTLIHARPVLSCGLCNIHM